MVRDVLSTSSARWRRASAIEASDSCLTCSHEDVAVKLTDAARMIFPVLLFNALAGLMSGSAPGARDLSFFVLAPSYRGIQRPGAHMPRAQHVRAPAPA